MRKHEPPITIAAIDIAMLVNLQKDAGMAKSGGDAMTGPVTRDAVGSDSDDFRRRVHGICG
jgi:hypothetical protein